MNLTIEKYYPHMVAILAAISWYCLDLTMPNGDGILSSSLTAGAIFAGFLSASKAILMSSSLKVMQRLKSTGYMSNLVGYLSDALWYSFALCAIAMIGFFVDTNNVWYGVLWTVLIIGAAASFVRFTGIMLKILNYKGKK